MKIRKGFVSNSSTSSFILPNKYDKTEIVEFVKSKIIEITKNYIEIAKRNKTEDLKSYINTLKEDILPEVLDNQINVKTVQEYQKEWDDLQEWYNLENIKDTDLVLYDTEDNFLNRITDNILEKYEVISYCTHMG